MVSCGCFCAALCFLFLLPVRMVFGLVLGCEVGLLESGGSLMSAGASFAQASWSGANLLEMCTGGVVGGRYMLDGILGCAWIGDCLMGMCW